MDPQFDKTPGLQLPQPTVERAAWRPPFPLPEHQAAAAPEVNRGSAQPPIRSAAPLAAASSPIQQAPALSQTAVSSMPANTVVSVQMSNDDLDQKYIAMAKLIVDETQNDPFLQSQKIGNVKLEYLKARQGKEMKAAET